MLCKTAGEGQSTILTSMLGRMNPGTESLMLLRARAAPSPRPNLYRVPGSYRPGTAGTAVVPGNARDTGAAPRSRKPREALSYVSTAITPRRLSIT